MGIFSRKRAAQVDELTAKIAQTRKELELIGSVKEQVIRNTEAVKKAAENEEEEGR